ncbi:MAG: GTP cyclohydrolase II [Archangium gephyra]|uniref:GTP cyclohydrolase-2 n=1 Tax=Archangium gephyra TaxID=48 RepID=A0A2W5SWK2_9BACT|nr:MAG: GTP cyclohydrolase II [Archangium gephyra]
MTPDALSALVERDRDHDCPGYGRTGACVRVAAVADLPTRFGRFRLVGFWNNRDEKEHVAMVVGDVCGAEDVPVRLHSECLTGDVMGSLRCDCREQLTAGLAAIQKAGRGVLLYMRQEGRGIGLLNKIRAYALQEQGLDTVEANLALGFRDDERDYSIAAHMLHSLDIKSVQLITNNPEKMRQLNGHGIKVTSRIPHLIPPNEFNRFYLETKGKKSGHLDLDRSKLSEQSDAALVDDSDTPPAT